MEEFVEVNSGSTPSESESDETSKDNGTNKMLKNIIRQSSMEVPQEYHHLFEAGEKKLFKAKKAQTNKTVIQRIITMPQKSHSIFWATPRSPITQEGEHSQKKHGAAADNVSPTFSELCRQAVRENN